MATITLVNGATTLTVDTDETDGCDTLADVLDLYRDTLNVPAGASISVEGTAVNPADVSVDDLSDGDEVVSTKTTGSKG